MTAPNPNAAPGNADESSADDEPSDTGREPEATPTNDRFGALGIVDFRWYLMGNLLFLFGSQMQGVAIKWEIYERTGSALNLGLVGLAQVLPVLVLALPAGQLNDRVDRRHVIMGSLVVLLLSSLTLAAISIWKWNVEYMFLSLFLNGVARAFQQPAKSALLPQLVPREHFANAVTLGTSSFQLATVVGPVLGGFLIWLLGATQWIYIMQAGLVCWFFFAVLMTTPHPPEATGEPIGLRSLGAGISFLLHTKLLLGAITLDMFAFMLGGATALLPIYAKDILKLGPDGLGWLQAAPGIGALVMSFALARRPPIQKAGATLLWSVAGFGFATIVFGFSRNFWLAWSMLALSGALDMVSVIIRHTLVQLWTPNAMRGRVSAVNGMFISISNELGEFESGLLAFLFLRSNDVAFGPTVSVVTGGVGSIIVVLIIAAMFPALRMHGRVDEVPSAEKGAKEC